MRPASNIVFYFKSSSKAAAAVKTEADKAFQAAEKAGKPKNIDIFPPSMPIVLTIKEHPATLGLSDPSGGNVKLGAKFELKITVKRSNGFQGPVTLNLPLPPNVKGLSAKAVTIPSEQNEGTLTVQVAADATQGQLENLVVRATMDFNGKAAVDQQLKLKVSK